MIHAQWTKKHKDEGTTITDATESLVDPLESCRIILEVMNGVRDRGETNEYCRAMWRDVLRPFSSAITTASHVREPTEKHRGTVVNCLKTIDGLEPCACGTDEATFASWAHSFRPAESLFDDELIRAFTLYIPEEDATFSPRVRRLQLLDPGILQAGEYDEQDEGLIKVSLPISIAGQSDEDDEKGAMGAASRSVDRTPCSATSGETLVGSPSLASGDPVTSDRVEDGGVSLMPGEVNSNHAELDSRQQDGELIGSDSGSHKGDAERY